MLYKIARLAVLLFALAGIYLTLSGGPYLGVVVIGFFTSLALAFRGY